MYMTEAYYHILACITTPIIFQNQIENLGIQEGGFIFSKMWHYNVAVISEKV